MIHDNPLANSVVNPLAAGPLVAGMPAVRHAGSLDKVALPAYRDDRRPKRLERKSEEIEFLPPMLEVLEKPLSPTLMWLMRLGYVTFTLAVVSAYFVTTEIYAEAVGKIEPVSGETAVAAVSGGRVAAVFVREGERVKKGAPLIELSRTEQEADLKEVTIGIGQRVLTRARLLAALEHLETGRLLRGGLAAHSGEDVFSARMVTLQTSLLESDVNMFEQALQARRKQIDALAVRHETLRERTAVIERVLEVYQQRASRVQELWDEGIANINQAESGLLKLLEMQEQERRISGERDQMADELAAAELSFREAVNARRRDLSTKLERVEAELDNLRSRERALRARLDERLVIAPFDAVVQKVRDNVHSGVLRSGDVAMLLLNTSEEMVMQAHVSNADISTVTIGQRVRIKLESFDYADYGVLGGEIASISPNAETVEGQGLIYPVTIALDREWMEHDGRQLPLLPGMQGVAGVVTGERTLLAWFLAPFEKAFSDAFHER